MSVPMVQNQKRKRLSLLIGALLGLLLGVAAGFVVLAMPIGMLETVTTFTRLSSLTIHAEPPISPYDRSVLAVFSGILAAGLGWVLVDWLVFGRAGMRTLIREREDDYEDEEVGAFRPTDPLDLVVPATPPGGEWSVPPAGDARRPLSARTDIGDPPRPTMPAGIQPAAMPGIDQLLPPIDQILPGVGVAATPPFVRSSSEPNPLQRNAGPAGGEPAGNATAGRDNAGAAPIGPVGTTSAPPPVPSAESLPAWLPTPGVRADGSFPDFDASPQPFEPPHFEYGEGTAIAAQPGPSFAGPAPSAPSMPLVETGPPESPNIPPQQRATDIRPEPQSFVPPLLVPAAPATQNVAATAQQPFAAPLAANPVPTEEPPSPSPARAERLARRGSQNSMPEPGFDRARLEELLERLERGLARRRAAQARSAETTAQQAAASVTPSPASPLHAGSPPVPPMPRAYPVSEPIASPPEQPMANPPFSSPPPVYAAPQQVIPTTTPVYDLPHIPPAPAYNLMSAEPDNAVSHAQSNNDELLNQPLHVTLELLRNRVKR